MADSVPLPDLAALRGFIFDMDGVVYRGPVAVPGAPEFIGGLRAAGIPFLFVTNNSTTSPESVALRLAHMGIPAEPDSVLTSSEVTAAVLKQEAPDSLVFVLGEEGIRVALARYGLATTEDYRQATAVVVGMDRRLTYDRLRDAALAVRLGARFIATNSDRTLPSDVGEIPGAGSLVAALVAATDVKPVVVGKPEPAIFRQALALLGTPAGLTACVGDRPETDIAGGHGAGLRTIAVLTGVGTRAAFDALRPPPDWIFEDLGELSQAYFAA
jgi:4-nitrophenyl phosphatase